MARIDRRSFLATAALIGATPTWAYRATRGLLGNWTERRDLYPQGVASGDPDSRSVVLWTRRPYADQRTRATLQVEVSEDDAFSRTVATTRATVSVASDWTCRVLVGGLKPSTEYWYRFTDRAGGRGQPGWPYSHRADAR